MISQTNYDFITRETTDWDDDEISTDKESARFWFIVTDTYDKSPFSQIEDSYEAVPWMMQEWIEAIEEKEKAVQSITIITPTN